MVLQEVEEFPRKREREKNHGLRQKECHNKVTKHIVSNFFKKYELTKEKVRVDQGKVRVDQRKSTR